MKHVMFHTVAATAVYFANNSTFDDITLRMGNIEKERHNNPHV